MNVEGAAERALRVHVCGARRSRALDCGSLLPPSKAAASRRTPWRFALITADVRTPGPGTCLHLLLLFAVGLVYTPLVLGLFALGAYVDKCTLRVLSRLDDLAAEPRRSE